MMWMLAYLVSWLPSWSTLAASGLLLAAALGAFVYQRLPLVPHRTLALIGAVVALYASAWMAGVGNSRAIEEQRALRAENRALAASVASERAKIAHLEQDARQAALDARAAEERARRAEEVAASLPDEPTISDATSGAIRDLWRR